MINNQIVSSHPELTRHLLDNYLSYSDIKKTCEFFTKIKEPVEDEYLSKLNLYCLVNYGKNEEAQLILDLKKELGFQDEYFENKMNYLFGYIEEASKEVSESSVFEFHLAHRTNPEFSFEPNENTPQLIWKYLSNSNFADYAYILLTIGVVMTSFYSWRLMFLVFNGKTRMAEEDYRKVHESSSIMLIPLMILAIGALFFGFIFKSYFIGYNSDEFWNGSIVLHHEDHHNIPLLIYYLPAILGVVGFFIAWMMYLRKSNIAKNIAELNKPLYNFLLNKWYFDELYNMVLVKPAIGIGKLFWKLIDGYIIDGFGPNGLASLVSRISSRTKQIQSGFIYHYAFAILIGLSLIITLIIFRF